MTLQGTRLCLPYENYYYYYYYYYYDFIPHLVTNNANLQCELQKERRNEEKNT